MKNKKALLIVFSLIINVVACIFATSAQTTSYPAEIIGRSLNTPGLGWIGHVGVVFNMDIDPDRYQDSDYNNYNYMYEVLNEDPVIQMNTFTSFKKRSEYWGIRYGIAYADYDRQSRIKSAAHLQKFLCPTYTYSTAYVIGEGDLYHNPIKCGVWRCDTFVTWLYSNEGYVLPTAEDDAITLPLILFNSFPYDNGILIQNTKPLLPTESHKIFNALTTEELDVIPFREFEVIADIPIQKETPPHVTAEWKLAQDPHLNDTKRGIFMDRLSIIGATDTLINLLNLYNNKNSSDAIKSKVIQDTMIYYQNHMDVSKETTDKSLLKSFYSSLFEKKLSALEASQVIRGYVDLSSPMEIFVNKDQLDKLSAGVEPHLLLGLKMQIMSKSKELENIYLPSIIAMLKKSNNPDLDDMFFSLAKNFYMYLRDPQSIKYIREYMDSVSNKYTARTLKKSPDIHFDMARDSFIELHKALQSRAP